jgi:hypothetical protein
VAEKYADSQASAADLLQAHLGAHTAVWGTRDGEKHTKQQRAAAIAVSHLTLLREIAYEKPGALTHFAFDNGPLVATLTKNAGLKQLGWQHDWKRQVFLLRDIFGNPFRPVRVDPAWLTSTVVSLAQAIDILSHCRTGGEHVRGCCLVDLLLGEE